MRSRFQCSSGLDSAYGAASVTVATSPVTIERTLSEPGLPLPKGRMRFYRRDDAYPI